MLVYRRVSHWNIFTGPVTEPVTVGDRAPRSLRGPRSGHMPRTSPELRDAPKGPEKPGPLKGWHIYIYYIIYITGCMYIYIHYSFINYIASEHMFGVLKVRLIPNHPRLDCNIFKTPWFCGSSSFRKTYLSTHVPNKWHKLDTIQALGMFQDPQRYGTFFKAISCRRHFHITVKQNLYSIRICNARIG